MRAAPLGGGSASHQLLLRQERMPSLFKQSGREGCFRYTPLRFIAMLYLKKEKEQPTVIGLALSPYLLKNEVTRTPIKDFEDPYTNPLYYILVLPSSASQWP